MLQDGTSRFAYAFYAWAFIQTLKQVGTIKRVRSSSGGVFGEYAAVPSRIDFV